MSLNDRKNTTKTQQPIVSGIVDPATASNGPANTSLTRLFSTGISRNDSNGSAAIIKAAIDECIVREAANLALPLATVLISKDQVGDTGIDGIVIYTNRNGRAAYYCLFTEDSTSDTQVMPPYEYGAAVIGAPKIQVKRPIAEMGRRAAHRYAPIIAQLTGVPESQVFLCHDQLITREKTKEVIQSNNPSAPVLTSFVNGLLFNALNVLVIRNEEFDGGTPRIITSDVLTKNTTPFSSELDIHYTNQAKTIYTNGGAPVRSSTEIFVSLKPINHASSNSDLLLTERSVLVAVNGYVEPHYNSEYEDPKMQTTHRYDLEFVITRIESPSMGTLTPQMYLLGMIAAANLSANNNVVPCLEEYQRAADQSANKQKGGRISRAISAFGYECLHLQAIPAAERKPAPLILNSITDPGSVINAITMAVNIKNLRISLDISLSEDQGWMDSLFLGAAINPVTNACNNQTDYDILYAWADRTTNGEFSKEFAFGKAITRSKNLLIPEGYFEDNGNIYDLREIDYLVLLNQFGKSLSVNAVDNDIMTEYTRVMDNPNTNEIERYNSLIKNILEQNYKGVVIKGIRYRVTFDADFVIAYINACRRSNITFSANQFGNIGDGGVRRHFNPTGTPMNATGLFNSANAYASPNATGNTFRSPWSRVQ